MRADQGKLEPTGISQPSVLAAVRADAPEAFACAQKVLMLLEMQMQHSLREDELTYLTIHIDRLAKDIWG